ncbi:helix-turn-helix transcriptional regulator [Sinomonas notoginsengisoli]|uniref:helix-turn-helix transcriptional regulator n=1 Tax=Sinomonas notoginsengisoli TaxID=1457311 RepID=UPI001F27C13D|nr:LuxR family transcriptional regulator [Sinomonas notoginsengisoli]
MPRTGQLVHDAQARVGDRLAWARVVRAKEIAAAGKVLAEPATYGVVITGDASFGKSAVASALLNDLEGAVHTVRLRSTIVGTETPYGALAVLLARLPEDAQDDPGTIMRGILQLLAADAGSRPAVLSLETSNNLDELSTATLVNVMVTGTAKLVIVADRASDLPADFHWMLAEERLQEVPLAALEPEEMVRGLRELLGGIVPQTVGLQLHAMSRGNPQVALLAVSELLQRETLTVSAGVWMLDAGADLSGIRQIDDLVRARIERQPAGVQVIIEALACARRIPLALLAAVFPHEDLAQMEREGLITLEDGGRHSVSLTDPLLGDVVRGWLSVPRRRELRALLMGDGEPPLEVMTTLELLGLAAWSRECHATLPASHAIAAATASLRLHDADFALECLDGVERDPHTWPTVQRLRARALLGLQLPHQALACLEQVSKADLEAQSPSAVAEFVATRAEAMRWLPDKDDEARALLEDARGELLMRAGTGAVPEAEHRNAAARLDLAEFEHSAFVGDFRRIIDRLEAMVDEGGGVDEEIRLRTACILMEARTVLGREQDGLALMHEIAAQMSQRHGSHHVRQAFASRAFTVLLYNGHWRQSLALLKGTPQWSLERLRTNGASVELAVGLAYVYAGRGRDALGPLLAATALLENNPAVSALGPAYAATAFAFAQTGDAASARMWLDRLEGWSGASSYQTRSYIEFCSDMARRWIGDPHAAARLIASARGDIAHGRWAQAGIKLVGATVEGHSEDLRLLEEVCGHRQGQLAELGGLLARGTRTGSLEDLIAAADLAAGLELDALESRCAAVALDRAREAGDAMMVRLMQARLDALAGRVPVLPVAPSHAPPVLTQREREVAALAATGTSNRRIAEDLGLSVRTVEGHLYQVFAKLSVSTRSELAGLV